MRAAELQIDRLAFPEDATSAEPSLDPSAALKQQVSERLAAHRSRRNQQGKENLVAIAEPKRAKARSSRIANAVAERYAQTQSYRDFLAAEAARAVEEANAAAEIAARNAEAVTVAQQQLLAELADWDEPKPEEAKPAFSAAPERDRREIFHEQENAPQIPISRQAEAPVVERTIQHPIAGLTVKLYEDVGVPPSPSTTRAVPAMPEDVAFDEEENFLLDDEIAFRRTPVFAEPAGPTVPIPANLIEFPRQLVAPRKARPRHAEGPLREEAEAKPVTAQLRIFEVEPEQISTTPSMGAETVAPEWSTIHLDATHAPEPLVREDLHALLPLETASLNLRAMAAMVDGCILGVTFLTVASGFSLRMTELPALPIAAGIGAAVLSILFVLYHLLFFTFSDATPGMRYARIGLCTFSDENPTRAQMRRRTWAILLSACPLGIGFLWALLDDDRLGWHDRISRMYQRSY